MRGYICKNFSVYVNSDDMILDFYEKNRIPYQTILHTLENHKITRDIRSDTWIEKIGMNNPFCVIHKSYFFDNVSCTYQSNLSALTNNIYMVFHRKCKILEPEIDLNGNILTCDFHVLKPFENKLLCSHEFTQTDKRLDPSFLSFKKR